MPKLPDAPQADSPFWRFWEVGTIGHATAYKLTKGRIGGKYQGAPIALVDSIGRKSGKRRTHPLIATEDGENLIVVASKGGVERNPAWYHNLIAHPEVELFSKGGGGRYRAREAEGAERERLWKLTTDFYPGYASYQERCPHRRIPVMVCSPLDD